MAVAALLSVALPAAAETPSQKADALLSGLIETNDPGLAVLVAKDGKILFEKGYGLADREQHVPVIPQTTFRIGSIGKQFTASAILRLQEKGKLSVNDKLSKYIPDFPRGDEVTLRHLLTHTSGIHSYTEKDGFIGRVTSPIKPDDLINSFKNDPYDFDPGKKWHYNNSGYFLLGRIVEKVSDQSYGDFLRENFFQPLGMTNTGVYRAHLGLPHEALGYSLEGAVFTNAVNWDMSWAGGAGTLYATVEDLFRWNEGVFNGRVLDAASLKAAFTPVKMYENQLNSDSGYGFAWIIGRHRGLLEISHGGGLEGFLTQLLRVPDEKFTVTVLANAMPGRTNVTPPFLAQQLVDIFLADKLAPPPIVNTNVSPKSYDALTGRYDLGIQEIIVTISRRGTHLFAQTGDGPEAEIFPKSDTEFFSKTGGQITFVKDNSGKVVRIIGHTDGSAWFWPGVDLVAPRVNDVAASSLDGDWLGGFERPGSHVYVHTHFATTNNETTGTIDVADSGDRFTVSTDWPLAKLQLTPPRVHFEVADKPGPSSFLMGTSSHLSFEGRMTNGVMTGVVEDSGKKLPFRLDLAARIDLSRYTGNYQVAAGHFISVAPTQPPVWLVAAELQSGQGGVLFPRSEADFVCGSGMKLYPVQAAIHFTTNQLGEVAALQWKPKNAAVLAATRIKALEKENVSFTNGDVTLSGTLVLPPSKGPHPAVVIVFGSSAWVRSEAEGTAQFFALNGVAALIYDKRGCGSSTGDFNKCSFDDFAGDTLAGVELLKSRPDINPHKIGIWGGSEGGWVISLAASRCVDVAFIINMSGPGITPEATSAYQVEHWMKAAGYSKADIDEACSLFLLNSRYERTGSNWNEVEAARKAAQNKPWYNSNQLLRNDVSGVDKKWELTGNYDPVPALRKVHCPVLAIFGELDPLVPVRKSAEIWKTALREAGNHDVVIKIFPHAGHTLADPRTGAPRPDSVALQRNWLLKHVTVND